MQTWLAAEQLTTEAAMQLDSFDLIVHLVSLGLGVGLVPQRALAVFPRKKCLQRVPWPTRLSRELAVIVRAQPPLASHVAAFVQGILF
jgi:DNA-binding transcriptional LysR family regulator